MSFVRLKDARQAKQSKSYASADSGPSHAAEEGVYESSAAIRDVVTQHTSTQHDLYQFLPATLEIRTSPKSGRGLWTKAKIKAGRPPIMSFLFFVC